MGIHIDDVTVTFKNGTTAVNHLSMKLDKGIYGLLGENGAGKTTLMRVLTTILKPSSGNVSLNGISYSERNYEQIRRKIGYLPQELQLYPDLTVRECLDYLGELSLIPKAERKRRIDYYLEKTSMKDNQKKKNKQLSGGMKRRVGLIQALLNDPEFLIVDEPTTGLDPEERIRIRNLLVEFARERTVLFSTHVVEDLAATCNELAVMRKGVGLYFGSMLGLVEQVQGHVWLCEVRDDYEARELEGKYHISSKQYTPEGILLKVIGDCPLEVDCRPGQGNLEDAYMYLMGGRV